MSGTTYALEAVPGRFELDVFGNIKEQIGSASSTRLEFEVVKGERRPQAQQQLHRELSAVQVAERDARWKEGQTTIPLAPKFAKLFAEDAVVRNLDIVENEM